MYVKSLLIQNSYLNQAYQRLLLILIFMLFALVGVQAQNAYTNAGLAVPTVTSDKDDYAPGEIAIITGTGWKLDSLVDIHLEEDPAHDHHHSYHDTKVNADGTWRIEYPIEERHLGTKFTVIVDGKQTGYQGLAYFTDGNVSFAASGLPNNTDLTVKVIYTPALPAGALETTTILSFKSQNNGGVAAKDGTPIHWEFLSTGAYSWNGSSNYTQGFIVDGNYNGNNAIRGTYVSCTSPTISTNPIDITTTYGSANPSFSVTASGSVSTYQWQLSTDNGDNWSNINGATSSNYTVENPTVAMNGYLYRSIVTGCNTPVRSNSAKLTVNQRPVSIAVNPKTKEYGNANPTLDGTISGLLAADNISVNYSTTATITSDVGTYPITATLSDPGNKLGNYAVTNTAANLTVTPASATITLSELSKNL